jgi:FkbM family methyltransferase
MKRGLGWLGRTVDAFNRAGWWRGACDVWDQRMHAATFERWLYLRLHRLGAMGREEQAILRHWIRSGMTVVDVGANLGLYTIFLSRLVGESGQVLAFEPDPGLFELLEKSVAANGRGNIVARPLALGRKAERVTLQRGILNSGDNYVGAKEGGAFCQPVDVSLVALDELQPELRPDFVKIDVQGWELPVLAGMERILRRNPAVVVQVEFWPGGCRRAGYEPEELISFLWALGFALFRADFPDAPLTPAQLADLAGRLTGLQHADLLARRVETSRLQ